MMSKINKAWLAVLAIGAVMGMANADAETAIKLFNSRYGNANVPINKVTQLVQQNFDINAYRQVSVQVIQNSKHQPDHLLIYLFAKKYHRLTVARVNIDQSYRALTIIQNYKLSQEDMAQQPGLAPKAAFCPDESIQFIAFAPNDYDLEQNITIDVANAAESHGLKTVRLLKADATRQNYLNYMKCPNVIGNFYDGDANPEVIATVDGVIDYNDFNTDLRNQFKYKMTNIWLACEAFNDPIKTSVMDVAQSQKYAAGINDLIVGPSDEAAACAMKEAMLGKPMKASFNVCYDEYDTTEDQWGFDGHGSDYFGT